jgi:putative transcriptional regulator
MKTPFEQMMNGLDDVEAFLAGDEKGFRVHVPEQVDVKGIRAKLKMTQSSFSKTFGFSLDAIKHWEGGRRTPEAPARTLLTVIDRNPVAVIAALQPQRDSGRKVPRNRRKRALRAESKASIRRKTSPKVGSQPISRSASR